MAGQKNHLTRRSFVKSSALLGAGALGFSGLGGTAFGASYPSRTVNIVVPTRRGGGADRDLRNFNSVWSKYFDAKFKLDFFAGGAGQLGYEIYMGKREPDCYNLLFGNMGPEVIMYALQNPNYKFPGDYYYINKISDEVMCIFTGANSKIKSIEQLVDEGKKRTVNIAVSRLPHPATIGSLSLAEAKGAKFNIVPYGGGGPSARAALSGEVDAVALPIAQPIKFGHKARTLVVFADKNPVPEFTNNAPTVNDVFGTKIPTLSSPRTFAVHASAMEKYPDRVKILKDTMKQTIEDPAYRAAVIKSGIPASFIKYGDQDAAMATAMSLLELAQRYKPLLIGKKKNKKRK